MTAHTPFRPATAKPPRGLIDPMGKNNMGMFDRNEERYARSHGIIGDNDSYGWRIIYINRLTGAYGAGEGQPYRTRVEAIEAMHAQPITDQFIAQGIERVRTHYETTESEAA